MNTETFLLLLIGTQVCLIALDLVERHVTRKTRYGGDPLAPMTVVFLTAVVVVYGALQYGGLALVPTARELLASIRELLAQSLDLRKAQVPLDGATMATLCVVGFYVAGLWDYIVHRFLSHSRWLWFTHENHHLPTQIFLCMPGLCVRPFAVVAIFPATIGTIFSIYVGLAVLGYPLWDLVPLINVVILAQVSVLTASHSSFLRRWWWIHHSLRCFGITTPQEHVLHHTVDLQGNYGNFTTVWDRVFGTYLDPMQEVSQGHRLGLAYDQDFLGAVTIGRFKLPTKVRNYFCIDRYCNIDFAAESKQEDRKETSINLTTACD